MVKGKKAYETFRWDQEKYIYFFVSHYASLQLRIRLDARWLLICLSYVPHLSPLNRFTVHAVEERWNTRIIECCSTMPWLNVFCFNCIESPQPPASCWHLLTIKTPKHFQTMPQFSSHDRHILYEQQATINISVLHKAADQYGSTLNCPCASVSTRT